MELNKLISIEEAIENEFIALASLEVLGKRESFDYENHFNLLNSLVDDEKNLLNSLEHEEIIKFRKQIIRSCNKKESSISLGHLTNAIYYRLLHLLDTLLGSASFDYATYLRYDLNQIIFSFLEFMISNEYYEDIKNDLIFYKFNLIFMNYLSENDFLKTGDISTISIESKCFKTDDNPDLIFVDKSILVLEGKEFIDSIYKLSEDFKENRNEYTLAVISIIELLARLTLSESDILHYLQQDFNALFEDDSVPVDVKDLIQEMLSILEQLKNKISLAK